MKVYKKTTFGKYLQILGDFVADLTAFIIIPFGFAPFTIGVSGFFLLVLLLIIMYYKTDRTNYPFFVELYEDRIRIRYYKDKFLQPFFMAKFIDTTIEFKNIKEIEYGRSQWHGSLYFYLQNDGYFRFTSINGSTVFKIYQDLEQALKEYRENEQLDKSQP